MALCAARAHRSMTLIIDGSKRSVGRPLRRLRPALTAVPQICRVASREALLISVCLPAMRAAASRMPRLVLGSPQYATTSRVRARSFFALAKPAACKNRTDAVIGSAPYTAAAAQTRYVNNSTIRGARLDTRAAARAAPRQTKFASQSERGFAYAPRARPLTAATHR